MAEAETLAEAQAAQPRIRNGSRSAMDGDKPAGTTSPEGIEAGHSAEKAPGTGPGAASEPVRSAAQSRTDTPPAPAALPREAGARLLLDARSADMGRALSERIVSGITRGQGSFDISLRPRNLGAVEVQLSLSQGAVTVKMRTQTEAAARLLTAGEQALAKGVEAAGMRLASVSAEVQPPPQTSTAQAGGQNGPGGGGFAMPQGQANGGGSGGRGTRSPDADAPRKRGPATSAADQTGATDRSYQLAHRKMVINLIA